LRKTLIKSFIVLVVFITTVIITSNIINLDSTDMTTEMGVATLPIVTIGYDGTEINRMYGYTQKMELPYMRECITPLMSGRKMRINIDTYGSGLSKMHYEVRTVDDSRLIEDTDITEYESSGRNIIANITIKDLIDSNKEYEFILVLTLYDGTEARYYSRVINQEEYHIADKLEFVTDFSSKTFNKETAKELKQYLEPNSTGNNSSFGTVNIHSSFNQITWGDLKVRKETDTIINIKELSSQTGSFLTEFYVSTTNENGISSYYRVQEYFRVRYSKTRMYLLDYERTMNEIFTDRSDSYNENDIILGISNDNESLVESADGNNIAFVTDGRLYGYNISENRMSFIYGFYDMYTSDLRQMNPNHSIKVMNVDESGNITFLVYGYMNRGEHEGTTGLLAYYYDAGVNTIEELAYLKSTKAPDLTIKNIDKLSYMNSDGKLYLLSGGTLYEINAKENHAEVITEDLALDSYQISYNGHMVAWQQGNDNLDCQLIELMNLETGARQHIQVESKETIIPISFIGEDLIYGIAKKDDITKDNMGNMIVPMYEVDILSEKEGILMRYSQDHIYVISGEVRENQLLLKRVKKKEDGTYEDILDDQIMNAQDVTSTKNVIDYVDSGIYEYKTRISLIKDIQQASMKHLTPKMVIFEEDREITLNTKTVQQQYVVYGKYGVDNFYADANDAVKRAYDIAGIVMEEEGQYIYKKTSRQAKNQIMAIEQRRSSENRSALAACIDTMLELEGVSRNSQYLMNQGESVINIFKEALPEYEVLDLNGCSLDMILYYVDMDIPVLMIPDYGDAKLIIGFNDTEIVLMDPTKEEIYKADMEEASKEFEKNGNGFITYIAKH